MDLELSPVDDKTQCVRLNGRLDSPGVDRVETRFSAAVVASGRNAAVDLSGVEFLASMGIRMLISVAKSLQAKGQRMVLFGANANVQSVLDTVAIDQIIPVFADQQQATQALAA